MVSTSQIMASTRMICIIITIMMTMLSYRHVHAQGARNFDGLLTSYDEMRMMMTPEAATRRSSSSSSSDDMVRGVFEQLASESTANSSTTSAPLKFNTIKLLKSSSSSYNSSNATRSVKHGGVADSRLVVLKAAQKIMDVYGEDGNDDDRPEAKPKHEALYSMKIPDDYCWKPKHQAQCNERYPYRSYDGSCNNLANHWWGAEGSSYKRLLPPHYDDGFNKMRERSVVRDYMLPSARLLSLTIHHEHPTKSVWTNYLPFFGQTLAHDITRTNVPEDVKCECDSGSSSSSSSNTDDECYSVQLPADDFHMRAYGLECIPFVRASGRWGDHECRFNPRMQWNNFSHYLDLGFIYSDDPVTRAFKHGLLSTSQLPNGERTFPRRTHECPLNYNEPTYFTPDDDAEQSSYLFSAQTIWLRNHNWLAERLAHECSHWDDERMFQEARRLNIAMYQHVVYAEYLPTLIGHTLAKKYDLLPLKHGYYKKYDELLYPQIMSEFAAAAYRLHTLVNHEQCYADAHLNVLACQDVQENIVTSRDSCDSLDYVFRGLVARWGYYQTPQVNFPLNNYLLKLHESMAVKNIQRGRDFGLQCYNEYRSLVGLNKAKTFNDLKNIPKSVREELKSLYANVDDIDLWTGGVSELPVSDGLIGKTLAMIIAKQFRDLKKGDRFYYENGQSKTTRFKLAQLDEIRKTYMASIICQNVKVEVVPKNPFVIADDELNPLIRCKDLKPFDFRLWSTKF